MEFQEKAQRCDIHIGGGGILDRNKGGGYWCSEKVCIPD